MHIHTFLYKLVKNMDSKGVPEVMYPGQRKNLRDS